MLRLPAQWEEQESTLIALPFKGSDWSPYLNEALFAFKDFIKTISKFQKVILLCKELKEAKTLLEGVKNIEFLKADYDDTWIRDYGPIDAVDEGGLFSYDFKFNAWGDKFQSSKDDKIVSFLYEKGFLKGRCKRVEFILEGGSIDSNGDGYLLTTSKCLLNQNRNSTFTKDEIEEKLTSLFGLKKLFWLENGHLMGDDTDAHIDTLARFINKNTIVYQMCNKDDIHYEGLKKLENELKALPFKLLKLPLPSEVLFEDKRLPATYINFLFVNGALIVPTYGAKEDELALSLLQKTVPNLNVVGVDAKVFIRQNGSLHCSSIHRFKR